MIRYLVLVVAVIGAACAKPLPSPSGPAFPELGTYAGAARSFSGCWAVRLPEGDRSGGFARLVILKFDTTVVSPADSDANPELCAYGGGPVTARRVAC